jgi:hypothetical protein
MDYYLHHGLLLRFTLDYHFLYLISIQVEEFRDSHPVSDNVVT